MLVLRINDKNKSDFFLKNILFRSVIEVKQPIHTNSALNNNKKLTTHHFAC